MENYRHVLSLLVGDSADHSNCGQYKVIHGRVSCKPYILYILAHEVNQTLDFIVIIAAFL